MQFKPAIMKVKIEHAYKEKEEWWRQRSRQKEAAHRGQTLD